MTHYANPSKPLHAANVAAFEKIESRFPWMNLTKPSPEKAPWHEQAIITSKSGATILLNFWPCAMKAQRDGCRAVEGAEAIRLMIAEAIDETAEDVDLLEDCE